MIEGAEKVVAATKGVPQRLKPCSKGCTYGTAKAVPLSETDFFSTLFSPFIPLASVLRAMPQAGMGRAFGPKSSLPEGPKR